MQIKTRYYILLEQLKKKLTIPNDHEDMENEKLSFTTNRNAKWNGHFEKTV